MQESTHIFRAPVGRCSSPANASESSDVHYCREEDLPVPRQTQYSKATSRLSHRRQDSSSLTHIFLPYLLRVRPGRKRKVERWFFVDVSKPGARGWRHARLLHLLSSSCCTSSRRPYPHSLAQDAAQLLQVRCFCLCLCSGSLRPF